MELKIRDSRFKIQDTGYRQNISHVSCIVYHTSGGILRSQKGQSILEYTVFIVMAALVFLALFSRSSLGGIVMGRWRQDVSSIGTDQYREGVSTWSYTNSFQSSFVGRQGFGSDINASDASSAGYNPHLAHNYIWYYD